MRNAFALNHMVAPRRSLADFLDLAVALDVKQIEIRNDIDGTAIADGTSPEVVRAEAGRRALSILSINALYPFNMWNGERAGQARRLIDFAKACGAQGIVMCPLNDAAYRATDGERLQALRTALAALKPMLSDAGVTGFVEPLGFAECSLRLKREAVEAIDAVDGAAVFKLVHDTFHHHVAGETAVFPAQTGLVHISGVDDPAVPASAMRDPHRVLVDGDDLIDNLGQIRALAAQGYAGPLSFEPFAERIAALADPAAAVLASMRFIRDAMQEPQ